MDEVFAGQPIRNYGAPMLSSRRADWGSMRATLIRRPRLNAVVQRFKLPWHAFRLGVAGSFGRGSTTRLDDGPRSPLVTGIGRASFYPAGTEIVNEVTGASSLTYLIVEIDSALMHVHGCKDGPKLAPVVALGDPVCLSLLDSLRREVERPTSSQRLFFDTAALMLLLSASQVSAEGPRKGGLAPGALARVTSYIADHLADDITLGELADLVGLSRSYLCRAFKASTGSTPHRWQLRARVERAQHLILRGELSLAAVAAATGFADQAHFTTAFRRVVGQAPDRWRKAQV